MRQAGQGEPGAQGKGISLDVRPAVLALLETRGYSHEFGARPVAKATATFLVGPLRDALLGDQLARAGVVTVDFEERSDKVTVL